LIARNPMLPRFDLELHAPQMFDNDIHIIPLACRLSAFGRWPLRLSSEILLCALSRHFGMRLAHPTRRFGPVNKFSGEHSIHPIFRPAATLAPVQTVCMYH
jgi:hypothetical protein